MSTLKNSMDTRYRSAIEIMAKQLGVKLDLSKPPYKDLYKENSEKPIKLWNYFVTNYEQDIPVPFIDLYYDLHNNYKQGNFNSYELGEALGIFWRLYAVYRHGTNYNIVMQQLSHCHKAVKDFLYPQIPILNKRLRLYIIVNRYMIMPLNRLINKVRGLI